MSDNEPGFYYLHTNGQLIYKRFDPSLDDSDFVRRVWRVDFTNRADAWTVILEALGLDADRPRVMDLAALWGCTPRDLVEFLVRVKPNDLMRRGLIALLETGHGIDFDAWLDWLASTPPGASPDFTTMPGGAEIKAGGTHG